MWKVRIRCIHLPPVASLGTKIKHTETSQKYEEAARNLDTIQLKPKILVIFMVLNCNKWGYHSMNWN